MALDVCLETYVSVTPFLNSDTVGAALRLPTVALRKVSASASSPAGADDIVDPVIAAADGLPFILVQVLWLIDVCGCSYAEASVELSTTPDVVADRVAMARYAIRTEIATKPPG